MCIAIYKPINRVLKDHVITNSYYNNPDGAGFAAWSPEHGLVVKKGFFTLAELLEAYEPFSGNNDQKAIALLHFRIATHGPIDAENCHPFEITCKDGYRVAVIHNGVISAVTGYDTKVMSDTAAFVHNVLAPAIQQDPKIWLNPAFQHVVESLIGYSKMILMDSEGNVAIYNQEAGMWDSDCWLSNSSYQYMYRSRGYACGYGTADYDDELDGLTRQWWKSSRNDNKDSKPTGSPTSTSTNIIVRENGRKYTWEEWLELKDSTVQQLQERGVVVDADTFPFGDNEGPEAEAVAQIAQEIAAREKREGTNQPETEVIEVGEAGTQLALVSQSGNFLERVTDCGVERVTDGGRARAVAHDRPLHAEICVCNLCSEWRAVNTQDANVSHTQICECQGCISKEITGIE